MSPSRARAAIPTSVPRSSPTSPAAAAAAAVAEVVTVAVGQSSNIVMPKILTELEQEHSFEHAADGDGTVSGGGGGVAGEGSIRLNLSPRNNQE
mmetsp:Transcript_28082/g.47193  ORF Transcript_28082/g.47193 Transcript_28082/m.47193 type:complete len:94 (-) Transcript_28082:1626-1907(-)